MSLNPASFVCFTYIFFTVCEMTVPLQNVVNVLAFQMYYTQRDYRNQILLIHSDF